MERQHPPAQRASAKTLGFFALFSISIGVIVGQTGAVSMLQALGIAGAGFFVAYVFAFLLAVCNALTFAELALTLPGAGGIGTYAEVTLGHFAAIVAVFLGYVVPVIFGAAAELMLFDSVIGQLFPQVLPHMGWALILLGTLILLNLAGTDVFATTQQLLTFVIIAFLFVVGLSATVDVHAVAHAGTPAWSGYLGGTSVVPVLVLCFWTLVGCEYVTPMVTEARAPTRDLPRSMVVGLAVIFAINMLFAFGTAHILSRAALGASVTPHLDAVSAVFGHAGRIVFAVIALTASASLINAVLGAVPRMLHGMAMNGQVFPIFKRVSARRRVPVAALLFVGACPVAGLVWARGDPNNILALSIAATICWMLVYLLAHVILLVLRARRPRLERPFRTPMYPLPQLAGIAGIVFVVFNSSPSPAMTSTIAVYAGSVIVTFGAIAAFWVRFVMKKDLFTLIPAVSEPPASDVAVSSRQ
jgi:amino acid transporter